MAIDRVYLAPLMKYLVGQKMMWISRIILNNWRAYDHTEFEIPRGDMDANVVIIGAKNGVGKTSLLEAITLCLYGERAIHYLSRGNIGIQNYKNFMDQAQYKFSDESSQKSSVSLLFETDNNKKILLERSWHFGGPNIGFRPPDELQIQVDGDPLPIPALEGLSNRTSFLEGYIADNFLPPDLLPFFLFDGGQVQKMAQRDMKDQIKSGIEGILGIPLIDKLIKDLEEYADQRGRQGRSGLPSDTKLDDMDRKIEEIHRKLKNIISSLESLTGQLKKAKMEQDALGLIDFLTPSGQLSDFTRHWAQ